MAAIVYGTYRTETVDGFVADFCPVCRDIQPFQVIGIGDASHLFLISLSSGQFAGRMIRCAQCGTGRTYTQARYITMMGEICEKSALIERTNPTVRAEFAERLALEERLRTSAAKLSAQEREMLLLEPFRELELEIEQLDKGTLKQKQASMWGMSAMCAVIGLAGASVRFQEAKVGWVVGAGIVTFLGVWAGILIHNELRGMKRRIMPSLARALRPLRPTKEELQSILARCRAARLCAGKKVKLDSLWTALQAGAP
jgi:uncharacterized membrane protein